MKTRSIGLVLYPGCMPAGLLAAADIFQAVNRRIGKPMLEPVWLSADGASVALPGGLAISAARSLDVHCDVYLLPGFWAESAASLASTLERNSALLDWLRHLPK
jgi:transcriptional regulator GlxA family with amidase domain